MKELLIGLVVMAAVIGPVLLWISFCLWASKWIGDLCGYLLAISPVITFAASVIGHLIVLSCRGGAQ